MSRNTNLVNLCLKAKCCDYDMNPTTGSCPVWVLILYLLLLYVVYFDQQTGTPLAVHWSNQFFDVKTTFCIILSHKIYSDTLVVGFSWFSQWKGAHYKSNTRSTLVNKIEWMNYFIYYSVNNYSSYPKDLKVTPMHLAKKASTRDLYHGTLSYTLQRAIWLLVWD